MRPLGVAGFSFRGCQVTFFEPLPIEFQDVVKGDDDEEEEEPREKRLARLRKQQADEDLYGSS